MKKIVLEEIWNLTQEELWEQIQIWTGIAFGFPSGSREAALQSTNFVYEEQMKLRERFVDTLAQGQIETARADFITWLQGAGYIEK